MENINNLNTPETPIQPIQTPITPQPIPPSKSNLFRYLFIFCFIVLLAAVIYSFFLIKNLNSKLETIKPEDNLTEITPTAILTEEVVNKVTPTIKLDSKTEQWQTYKSEKYGFNFKYPKGFVVTSISNENEIILSDSNDGHWLYQINIENNLNNITLEKIFNNKLAEKIDGMENKNPNKIISNITVDSKPAKKYLIEKYGDYGNTGVVLVSGTNIITIYGDQRANNSNNENFDILVSTFKFTN